MALLRWGDYVNGFWNYDGYELRFFAFSYLVYNGFDFGIVTANVNQMVADLKAENLTAEENGGNHGRLLFPAGNTFVIGCSIRNPDAPPDRDVVWLATPPGDVTVLKEDGDYFDNPGWFQRRYYLGTYAVYLQLGRYDGSVQWEMWAEYAPQ
jgi:hypothetical protein